LDWANDAKRVRERKEETVGRKTSRSRERKKVPKMASFSLKIH